MRSGQAPYRRVADGVHVALKVTPKASADRLQGLAEEADGSRVLKVAVTAPPEDGKANAAVLKLLAKTWRLPKSDLSLISGASDRRKRIHIVGDPECLGPWLDGWLADLES